MHVHLHTICKNSLALENSIWFNNIPIVFIQTSLEVVCDKLTDVSRILPHSDGRMIGYRHPGERFVDVNARVRHQFGRGNVVGSHITQNTSGVVWKEVLGKSHNLVELRRFLTQEWDTFSELVLISLVNKFGLW